MEILEREPRDLGFSETWTAGSDHQTRDDGVELRHRLGGKGNSHGHARDGGQRLTGGDRRGVRLRSTKTLARAEPHEKYGFRLNARESVKRGQFGEFARDFPPVDQLRDQVEEGRSLRERG